MHFEVYRNEEGTRWLWRLVDGPLILGHSPDAYLSEEEAREAVAKVQGGAKRAKVQEGRSDGVRLDAQGVPIPQ